MEIQHQVLCLLSAAGGGGCSHPQLFVHRYTGTQLRPLLSLPVILHSDTLWLLRILFSISDLLPRGSQGRDSVTAVVRTEPPPTSQAQTIPCRGPSSCHSGSPSCPWYPSWAPATPSLLRCNNFRIDVFQDRKGGKSKREPQDWWDYSVGRDTHCQA